MIIPVLEVQDVDSSITFYTKKLGFTEQMKLPGPDGVTAFASVGLGDATLMLSRAVNHAGQGKGVDFMVYIPEDADIDTLCTDVQSRGVKLISEMQTQYWGDRSFAVNDPDGYRITLAQEVEQVDMAHIASVMRGETLA